MITKIHLQKVNLIDTKKAQSLTTHVANPKSFKKVKTCPHSEPNTGKADGFEGIPNL